MSATYIGRVDTVLASAGTGKTTFLVRRITRSIAEGIEPERIFATTFTRKAAAELDSRVRDGIARDGTQEHAVRLAGARIGTVNAVCGAICREFAFELGISPVAEVVDEDVARALFFTSAADVIAAFAPALSALSEAFGLAERGIDWRDQVHAVAEAARANGIGPQDLDVSADRSVAGLLDLLPRPADAAELDASLREEIELASAALSGRMLKTGSLRSGEALLEAGALLSRGETVPWPLWARLGKPNAAKSDMAAFAGVARAACRHPEHPRLRADLKRFVRLVMSCAARAMAAFRRAKTARALLDFGDQETLTLAVLAEPTNHGRLRELIGAVFVDELQDSSPTQVAVFAALARVVQQNVWVGDPKQGIFAFRSADPTLTLAAARGAASETGGETHVLSTSWRSRPGICRFVDDCFVPFFERLGLTREQAAFSGSGRNESQAGVPPIAAWYLDGKNKRSRADGIAAGIAAALADHGTWPVASGTSARGLRAGDVAILCRSNDDVEQVASALTRLGLAVAEERGDLLESVEGQLFMAAIRWVVDRSDRLALAELVRLTAKPDRQSAWLEALADPDPVAALVRELSFALALDAVRGRLLTSSVVEMVDAILVEGGIVDAALEWGDGRERLPLLEAMRGLASAYENCRRRARVPETLGDFALWATNTGTKRPSSMEEAVTVLTYHRSKGLEWPLVVCAGLDEEPRTSLFQPVVEVDGEIDWRDPFARRWIRFWPWPYGRQSNGIALEVAARESDAGRRATRLAEEEAVRLLYVGMTRPRDYLVLALPSSREPTWLRLLDTRTSAHVELPGPDEAAILVGGSVHGVRPRLIEPAPSSARPAPIPTYLPKSLRPSVSAPLRQIPSSAASAPCRITNCVRIGGPIPLRGKPDMTHLGDALHAFLASDDCGAGSVRRGREAKEHLARWGLCRHLDPMDVVRTADRLQVWLEAHFPGAQVRREASIHAVDGNRAIVGRIDLLIEGKGWFVLVDHKAFPGGTSTWDARAKSHAHQLALYAQAVHTVTGSICRGAYLHLPIAGIMVEVAADGLPSLDVSKANTAVTRRRRRTAQADAPRLVHSGPTRRRRFGGSTSNDVKGRRR